MHELQNGQVITYILSSELKFGIDGHGSAYRLKALPEHYHYSRITGSALWALPCPIEDTPGHCLWHSPHCHSCHLAAISLLKSKQSSQQGHLPSKLQSQRPLPATCSDSRKCRYVPPYPSTILLQVSKAAIQLKGYSGDRGMEGWLVTRHWSLSQRSAGRQVGRNKVEVMKEGPWTGNVLKVYFSQVEPWKVCI